MEGLLSEKETWKKDVDTCWLSGPPNPTLNLSRSQGVRGLADAQSFLTATFGVFWQIHKNPISKVNCKKSTLISFFQF